MKKKNIWMIVLLLCFMNTSNVYAQRGCCSHHSGSSDTYTTSGRLICNDGTISPTCTGRSTSSQNTRYTRPVATPVPSVPGCMDPNAFNYNANATVGNGTCILKIYGCRDSRAINYNPNVNVEDQSCRFAKEEVVREKIVYSSIYKKDANVYKGQTEVKRTGYNGEREVLYRIIVDENAKIVSEEKVNETIIKEAHDEIIRVGTKEMNLDVNILYGIHFIILIIILLYARYISKDAPILIREIRKDQNRSFTIGKVFQILTYFTYFAFLLPVWIDFILCIFDFIKKTMSITDKRRNF